MERHFNSPAKINLCLHVLGRRLDGYHELAMAMQRVDLSDRIRIQVSDGSGVRVSCAGLRLDVDEENIAAKAAKLVLAESRRELAITISIEKNIPVAAGLGGGSSNAATVLAGLDKMLGLELGQRRLMELGAQLGADVPFFIYGAPAWATGTGTQLDALPSLPDVAYLLVNPKIAVSTAWVYQSLELTKGGELANLPRFSVVTRDDLCAALHNDLERVTLQRYPLLAEIKQLLLEYGACGSLMSGSGATVFGVFADYAEACRVAEELKRKQDWLFYPVKPL
ncbi:4-diphosphocytidyl-2-C-methyl-D-erythritol kinase [Malonomonas rubra DSM 5091]|uniref:4-diphosphocytidyl-2-C-methyl-D-erythritol kinase n=1 Tax=Malonomonas rubra DSM 5091 TaxID=1122189 RepID=A0A1M6E438_MALRU|nr:4-(cytidine 5'-diphospho)-2-C-methyl-D-erythritol kinase [Malonomonas rubra]SHI80256.1 4-diphosphocytidyl-2-C-methyl-D-erythritol kinase [Malonomonas rubra DSM 5091]